MLSITKQFSFEASHQLYQKYQAEEINRLIYGTCSRVHGHSFKLFVTVTGPVEDTGMILNYKDLSKIVEDRILSKLDHQHLNDVLGDELPITSEFLIQWIADRIHPNLPAQVALMKLVLYETEKCFCTLEFSV